MKAREQADFKKPWVGCVEVITGSNTAKFTSIEADKDGKVKPFPDGTNILKVGLSDLPKSAQRVIKPGMKDAKRFRIRLNADADAVDAVTPVSGMFPAKLVELGPKKKDEDARPMERFFKKGQPDESSHLEFFAVYEITQGVFRGVQLPAYFLHYKFEGIPEGEEGEGFTRFNTANTPQASQLRRLNEWAAVHGDILEEDIAWEPDDELVFKCRPEPVANILPVLEERALDADRDVNVIIEKGYIVSVQAVENYETEDDNESDEVDEAFPPTESVESVEEVVPAPAKKVAAKAKTGTKKPPTVDDDADL